MRSLRRKRTTDNNNRLSSAYPVIVLDRRMLATTLNIASLARLRLLQMRCFRFRSECGIIVDKQIAFAGDAQRHGGDGVRERSKYQKTANNPRAISRIDEIAENVGRSEPGVAPSADFLNVNSSVFINLQFFVWSAHARVAACCFGGRHCIRTASTNVVEIFWLSA